MIIRDHDQDDNKPGNGLNKPVGSANGLGIFFYDYRIDDAGDILQYYYYCY